MPATISHRVISYYADQSPKHEIVGQGIYNSGHMVMLHEQPIPLVVEIQSNLGHTSGAHARVVCNHTPCVRVPVGNIRSLQANHVSDIELG